MGFLKYYTNFEKQGTEKLFEEQVAQLTDKKITMGIEELLLAREKHYGRLEGKAEGKAEGEENKSRIIVENLIIDFGFTNEQAAKAAAVPLDFVKKIRAELEAKKKEE